MISGLRDPQFVQLVRRLHKVEVWDIAKAHQSILTTIIENFLRLVVWRMEESEED